MAKDTAKFLVVLVGILLIIGFYGFSVNWLRVRRLNDFRFGRSLSAYYS